MVKQDYITISNDLFEFLDSISSNARNISGSNKDVEFLFIIANEDHKLNPPPFKEIYIESINDATEILFLYYNKQFTKEYIKSIIIISDIDLEKDLFLFVKLKE
jgi:hypothetical protein